MLKILGAMLIIMSTSAMGYLYSFGYRERVRQLRELQFSLNSLSSEILYASNPLWIAFSNVSKVCTSPFKELFLKISENLKNRSTETLVEAFNLAYNEYKEEFYLEKEDIELLNTFIQGLSSNDTEGHKKNFNIAIKKLESIEKDAEDKRQKNEKLYNYLGVLSGLLIVILLV